MPAGEIRIFLALVLGNNKSSIVVLWVADFTGPFMKFVFLCFLSILCFIFYFDALYALNNKPRYDEQRTEELRQYLINYFSPVRNPQKIAKITLLKIIPQLIELGADPDTSTKKGDGFRAIDFAARNNYIDLIHFLFKHGADINANSTDSMRALYQAARRGHEETSAFLITISAKTKTEALKQNLCRFSYSPTSKIY